MNKNQVYLLDNPMNQNMRNIEYNKHQQRIQQIITGKQPKQIRSELKQNSKKKQHDQEIWNNCTQFHQQEETYKLHRQNNHLLGKLLDTLDIKTSKGKIQQTIEQQEYFHRQRAYSNIVKNKMQEADQYKENCRIAKKLTDLQPSYIRSKQLKETKFYTKIGKQIVSKKRLNLPSLYQRVGSINKSSSLTNSPSPAKSYHKQNKSLNLGSTNTQYGGQDQYLQEDDKINSQLIDINIPKN